MQVLPTDRPVAFITGAGAGFGESLARSFAADGIGVVVTDIDCDAAERVAAELNETSSGIALSIALDVADPDSFATAVQVVQAAFGRLDYLINNAGMHLTTYSRPISELSRDQLRGAIDVNILGVVHGTLACRPLMAAGGGGAVVSLSSISAYGVDQYGIYGVTKLAVRGLTIAFADELAADGIRVNAVAPGLIATDKAVAALDPALFEKFIAERQVIKRRGEPSDVINAVRFLCSDQASFITGETIKISGGYPLIP